MKLTITRRPDGYWIKTPDCPHGPYKTRPACLECDCGPYERHRDALDDKAGLERFYDVESKRKPVKR